MQVYKIAYDFNHEEKIFGGYLSIRQVIYLILGASMMSIFLIPINVFIKSMMFLITSAIFIAFAFLKVDETNADKYFFYIMIFLFRKRKYILEKKGKRE